LNCKENKHILEERKQKLVLPGVWKSSFFAIFNRRSAATLNGGFLPLSTTALRRLWSAKPGIRYWAGPGSLRNRNSLFENRAAVWLNGTCLKLVGFVWVVWNAVRLVSLYVAGPGTLDGWASNR